MTPVAGTAPLAGRVLLGGCGFHVALAAPVSLARALEFDVDGGTRFFGAPPATSTALRVGGFHGVVAGGGSCNCSTLSLTPHCHGTHTECIGHLTTERIDAWRVAPRGLMSAILITVKPDGHVIGRDVLATALAQTLASTPPALRDVTALILRTGCPDDRMAHLSPAASTLLVEHGIAHVVLDLASMDPAEDGGELAAHRVFFGLPARHQDGSVTHAAEAKPERARCTITELARIPSELADGACLLQLALPELGGDAVPSSPLLYPLVPA